MENPVASPAQDTDSKPTHLPKPKDQNFLRLVVILILVIGIALSYGTYHKKSGDVSNITTQNSSLNSQITSLNNKIKQQQDTNNGVVPAGSVYKDPSGEIGLLNGAITLTLPSGWVRVPSSSCTGGTIDSTIVCQDIAAVAPKSLVKSDGTVSWSVPIKVFDYSSSDGSAENWFNTKYTGALNTGAINVFTAPINGYSAYSFDYQAFDIYGLAPEYTEASYAVAHGKYAIAIDAIVKSGSTPSAQGSYDYRNTYQLQIEQMLKSIKIQD